MFLVETTYDYGFSSALFNPIDIVIEQYFNWSQNLNKYVGSVNSYPIEIKAFNDNQLRFIFVIWRLFHEP